MNIKRGPGYFKLNSSLLLDSLYQENVKQSINETILINRDVNPNTLWELIKSAVRNETIKYATKKKKESTIREESLKADIQKLTNIITTSPSENIVNHIKTELQNKQRELEEVIDIKLNGQILRSKGNIIEHNEKNSKYFASLEKKKSETKLISRLQINDKISTDQKEILTETEKYYKVSVREARTMKLEIQLF